MMNAKRYLLAIAAATIAFAPASAQREPARVSVTIDTEHPGARIEPAIYGQFAEHLGRGIYEGIWVGEGSAIPNTDGYRNDVLAALRPGLRQCDLSGLFTRRVFELGAHQNTVDPIWEVMPDSVATGQRSVTGDLVFPTVTSDRALERGDVIWCDSGITLNGYDSDFGRTWTVGAEPSTEQRDQFRRWKDVIDAVLAITRPGVTGADLTCAARNAYGPERTPWLSHLYLAHGIGVDSAEAPFIGTDLGPAVDESIVLMPGMVFVLEPIAWADGTGGYRSEEIVVITEDGYMSITDYPYAPYGQL